MIIRQENTRHGYKITYMTNGEFQQLCRTYPEKVKCIICNKNTSRRFIPSLFGFGNSIITINLKVPDDVIYINHCF